ncbi:hypothetical protein FACHB389_24780 [Nostoc calcicola FACHB-389]|nr:hypothetical protein FACHB389_24780 [Nostoc calcicola FACHB-389]
MEYQVEAIAVHLQSLCSPGDRALLLYPPALDFIASFFARLYAGIIRPLAKVLFATGGKRVKVKGEGNNTELFPLPLFPTYARSLLLYLPIHRNAIKNYLDCKRSSETLRLRCY